MGNLAPFLFVFIDNYIGGQDKPKSSGKSLEYTTLLTQRDYIYFKILYLAPFLFFSIDNYKVFFRQFDSCNKSSFIILLLLG